MTIDACVTLGVERETVLSSGDLVRQMDDAGVDRAVVQPEDRLLAVEAWKGNGIMLEAARHFAGRLIPACTANPWFGQAALDSILRAISEGARMVVFAPAVQGFILGDEILFPLLDALAAKKVPIYFHTGPHLHATPWQLAHLAERYPTLPFIMGHAGATDYWNDVPAAAASLPNIYIESSFARPFLMKSHLEKAGAGKGIMGSGAPRNGLKFEWDQMRQVFPPDQYAGLFGGTLATLLKEVRP